jgi:D-aminopeptidase
VRSINPVVGETNDGHLNDIRRRALTPEVIRRAIETARGGPVEEGSVGAGTGTCAFGWKGGMGTSSRALAAHLGGYTVGALVQSNYGGDLQILGLPVGRELGPRTRGDGAGQQGQAGGSIMIVVATDAPLSDRNLTRLARRALAGLARTGAAMSNGSGDYVIAFSAAASVRRTPRRRRGAFTLTELANERVSPLFQAVIEATEEAIYNSLFKATTVSGYKGTTVEALPLDRVVALLQTVAIVPRSRSGP